MSNPLIEDQGTQAWSKKQWLLWLAVPVLVLVGVKLTVLLLGDAALEGVLESAVEGAAGLDGANAHAYWLLQKDWFITLNASLSSTLTHGIWYNLTLLGDGAVLLPLAFLGLYWRPQIAAALIATLPLGAVLSSMGKAYFSMPRPAAVFEHAEFVIIGETLAGHSSLPSGHSITYFAVLVAVLAVCLPKPGNRAQWLAFIAAVGVFMVLCLSRVAVAAHWPLDLLVGASLGTIAGVGGAGLTRFKPNWWQKLFGLRRRFIFVPLFLLWAWILFGRVGETHFFAGVIYLAAIACLAVVAWMFTQHQFGRK